MSFKAKWIWDTWLGWVIGIVAALTGLHLMESSISIGFIQQTLLGIIVSFCIASAQAFVLRSYFRNFKLWILIYVISFAICFVSAELIGDSLKIRPEIYMPIAILFAAAITGYLHSSSFFKIKGKEKFRWILWYVLSWLITVFFLFVVPLFSDAFLTKSMAQMVNTMIVLFYGLLFGVLTGNISRYCSSDQAVSPTNRFR